MNRRRFLEATLGTLVAAAAAPLLPAPAPVVILTPVGPPVFTLPAIGAPYGLQYWVTDAATRDAYLSLVRADERYFESPLGGRTYREVTRSEVPFWKGVPR
jgi:hypothetical protein